MPVTRYARSGDVNVAYQVVGEGPYDVVFVPPFVTHVELLWRVPSWAAFNRRLAALSRVQGLLSHLSVGERVTFDQLLHSELSALGAPDEKVTLAGPAGVPLRSIMVQTLALTWPGSRSRSPGHITQKTPACSAAFSNISQPLVVPGRKALHRSPSSTALPAASLAVMATNACVIRCTSAGSISLCAVKQQ